MTKNYEPLTVLFTRLLTIVLPVIAAYYAMTVCVGKMYEPEIPDELL